MKFKRIKDWFKPKPIFEGLDIQIHAQSDDWSGAHLLTKLNVYSVSITEDNRVNFVYKGGTYKSGSTFKLTNGESYWLRAEVRQDEPPKLWVSLPLSLDRELNGMRRSGQV